MSSAYGHAMGQMHPANSEYMRLGLETNQLTSRVRQCKTTILQVRALNITLLVDGLRRF